MDVSICTLASVLLLSNGFSWIKHLPQNAYDQTAERLINFGIFEKAQQTGALDLARSIEAILKAPFKCTVPARIHGEWILSVPPLPVTNDEREPAAEQSPRKRWRPDTEMEQEPCISTTQPRQVLAIEEEVFGDSRSPVHDTGSCSFQSDSFASTSSITPSQSNSSTPPTTPNRSNESTPSIAEDQPSFMLNNVNYEAAQQLVLNTQGPNRSYTQPETSQLNQGLSSSKRLRCRNDDIQRRLSSRSGSLHSPSPPQNLLVSESLLRTVELYFANSCRNMIFDEHGTLLNPNGTRSNNDLCDNFDSYCFTASMLMSRKSYVGFGHALSKASALVKQMLQAEHPRTLPCFLEVFIHLIQTGLHNVASFLRRFIKDMSAEVIRDGQLWGKICRLLGELDAESLDEAMARIWKCTTDAFETELGTSSRLAVSVRLDYIKRVFGFTNKLEEEWLLRHLLRKLGGIPSLSTPRVLLNLAHNLNRQKRHEEAEDIAWKVLSLLQEHELYAGRIVERIECLKVVSHSQFGQGNPAAEQTMRKAIQLIAEQWGIQHSWFLEFMNVLESWFRDWGREDEANRLWEEIEVLRRKDQIDEQLNPAGSS